MTAPVAASWLVLDVEGTLGPADQVRGRLYDYARPRLASWLDAHRSDPVVGEVRRQTRELAGLPAGAGTAELGRALCDWQDQDLKFTPLKTLQGLIWQHGYAAGDLVSTLFGDVAPALRGWHRAGLRLAVFSSGSVAAQQAYLRHTGDGDLAALVSRHFDTANAGPKHEPDSYRAIRLALGCPARSVLFLSDAPAELAAAAAAGWQVAGVARAGEAYADADFGGHRRLRSLAELTVVPA